MNSYLITYEARDTQRSRLVIAWSAWAAVDKACRFRDFLELVRVDRTARNVTTA